MGEITADPKGEIRLINNLNKASGPDDLSARVLKECSSEVVPTLALIYNESFTQGTAPDDWRKAKVAPVFKKGEKNDAENYKPVSQNPGVIESNINKHLAFESILANCRHSLRIQRFQGLRKPTGSVLS